MTTALSRRSFFQSAVATVAGFVLPPTLIENTEDVRRYWALDRTMVSGDSQKFMYHQLWSQFLADDSRTPFVTLISGDFPMDDPFYWEPLSVKDCRRIDRRILDMMYPRRRLPSGEIVYDSY